jgi:uncharacterized DUF497 family protein
VAYEWDPKKNERNVKLRGIHFADATAVLEDEYAITLADNESDPTEKRWVTIGLDALGRILVVVYTYRGENIRIISARLAEPHEREEYEAQL